MSILQNIIFFGIPQAKTHSPELKKRINAERSKIYFHNAVDTLTALFLGLILAIVLLSFFKVSTMDILLWAIALSGLGVVVFVYEKSVIKEGFSKEIHTYQVLIRLLVGFSIALVWGFFPN